MVSTLAAHARMRKLWQRSHFDNCKTIEEYAVKVAIRLNKAYGCEISEQASVAQVYRALSYYEMEKSG